MKADVVEKGKDYCAECWFQYFSGETMEQYEKRQNELEERRRKKSRKQMAEFLALSSSKL